MSDSLRQRRKPEDGEESDDPDSPVLVEREPSEGASSSAEDRLTARLMGGSGPTKDPLQAATGAERPGKMKVPKGRRRAGGEQAAEKGGIRWLPIVFLLFMVGPGIFAAVDFLLQLPFFAKFRGPPNYRQCLTDYYRRVHPERLQEVDLNSILRKYKGKEGLLARNLESRYGRKFKCP